MDSPREMGLPHDEWRPYQKESVEWAKDITGFGLLEAPVGSGKSGIAKATGCSTSLVALVRTKSLQQQYANLYDVTPMLGKSNYACIHHLAEPTDTANDCLYKKKTDCDYYDDCPYVIAKSKAMQSNCLTLNYALFLSSYAFHNRHPDYLFLDEAHLLSDITLDWVGIRITDRDIREFNFRQPPKITGYRGLSLTAEEDPTSSALHWLTGIQRDLSQEQVRLYKSVKAGSNLTATKIANTKRRLSRCTNLLYRVESTITNLGNSDRDWFIRSGPQAVKFRESYVPGFIAKPLTARYHFMDMFNVSDSVILMSGTVGDFDTFARELGIKEYVSRRVPSQFPPEIRPVYILDAPKMSAESTGEDYNKQADVIAKAILDCDSSWSGVIHTTRKKEAQLLADRLARRGLQDRVWVTPDIATDKQLQAWVDHKDRMRSKSSLGQIAVTWSWREGVDLTEESICICSKLPFPDIGEDYEAERLHFSASFYNQRTAWSLQQQCGRTRRDEDDYGQGKQLVAIADSNWTRVKKYLSEDFRESIVTL